MSGDMAETMRIIFPYLDDNGALFVAKGWKAGERCLLLDF